MPDSLQPQDKGKVRPLNQESISDLEFGRKMPQAIDIEEAVLGAILIDRDALIEIIDVLKPESFYKDAHQTIYQAILDLFEHDEPIDLVTVSQVLRKNDQLNEVGGAYYLTYLTNKVASSAHVKHYAHIVLQKALKRELIHKNTSVIKEAYEDVSDVFDLLDKAEQELYDISEGNIGKEYEEMDGLTRKAVNEIQELLEKGGEFTGIPSGFSDLDRMTGGWQKSDLIIVAARPSMGKTAFTLNMARNASVNYKKPVAVFSLEMSSLQLALRLISSEAELSQDEIKRGNLREDQIQQIISRSEILRAAPIFIDDTPAINIFQLRAKCRRLKRKHDIQLVIIDYLQLMSGVGRNRSINREQEISRISRSLKTLAKELEIPVIALSQLSREVERRADKRPMLSDLRESGAIEQDADMVVFLYRPEYYGLTSDEQGKSTRGVSEIIISKHRNGSVGSVKVKFIAKYAKFVDFDHLSGYIPLAEVGEEDHSTIIRPSKINGDSDVGEETDDFEDDDSNW